VPRYLSCTSNSRDFPEAPPTKASFIPSVFPNRYGPNSLLRNILPINPLNTIFCGELFLLPVCFQYFAEVNARGVFRREVNRPFWHRRFPSCRAGNLNFALCSTATLVYGVRFATHKKEFGRRIGFWRRTGHLSALAENGTLEPKAYLPHLDLARQPEQGELLHSACGVIRRAGPKPSSSRRETFSGNPDTTQLDRQSPGSG
jgi:hypothetical protein